MPYARWSGAMAVAMFALVGNTAAQPPSPPASGPVGAVGEATTQDYAMRLRDAEAKLRAAHERLAAAGASGRSASPDSPTRQELLDAVREVRETVRSAPGTMVGRPAHAEAERRSSEALERLSRGGPRGGTEADEARSVLQALSALREAAGAPPAAEPATGGTAPAEPAAGGGGRT